jgi:hypothetical protein
MSMTLIPTFIPFLFLFAAAIKLQWGDDGPGRGRTAASRGAVSLFAGLGFLTVAVSMVLAVLPPDDDPDPTLYVGKVVGQAFVLVGSGVVIYLEARSRRSA